MLNNHAVAQILRTIPTPEILIEYRCTRPDSYTGNCLGASDTSSRQGHYREATSEIEAAKLMSEDFPNDSAFDVQVWFSPDVQGRGTTVQRFMVTRAGIKPWASTLDLKAAR